MYLLTPGPSQCDEEIMKQLSSEMMYHRDPLFLNLYFETHNRVKEVFQSKEGQVCIFNGSGTFGMEQSIASLLKEGDEVLVISTGAFGDRFVEINERYGVHVHLLRYAWGTSYHMEDVQQIIEDYPKIKAIFVTHCETSTGILNALAPLGELCKVHDCLFIVDTISGLIMNEFKFDEWGIDVAIAASQKGFSMPCGLVLLCYSKKALSLLNNRPAYVCDIKDYVDRIERKVLLSTVNTPYIKALHTACGKILEEGLPQVQARYNKTYTVINEGMKALGYVPFVEEHASRSLLVFYEQPSKQTYETLKMEGILIAKGMKEYEHKVIRIGNMNVVDEEMIVKMLCILKGENNETKNLSQR